MPTWHHHYLNTKNGKQAVEYREVACTCNTQSYSVCKIIIKPFFLYPAPIFLPIRYSTGVNQVKNHKAEKAFGVESCVIERYQEPPGHVFYLC